MMWWLVVLVSAALIAIGVALLVRDIFQSRMRRPRVAAARADQAQDDSPGAKMSLAKVIAGAMPHGGRAELASALHPTDINSRSMALGMTATTSPVGPVRSQKLEKLWTRLVPEIETAVAGLNKKMMPLALSVGPPGDSTWSLHNEGFGDYRRVIIAGESVAWLRLEVAADKRIRSRVRAHDAGLAEVNRDQETEPRRDAGALDKTLTACLAGVFDHAVWRHSNKLRNDGAELSSTRPPVASPIVAGGATQAPADVAVLSPFSRSAAQPRGTAPLQYPIPAPTQQAPTQRPTAPAHPARTIVQAPPPAAPPAPSPAAAMVDAAVALVNRAFADAGAQLVQQAYRRDGVTTLSDRALSIVANGREVALMLIEPRADKIEISVGVSDPANVRAARRQAHPMAGLSVHALAEAIATNAWPAIAVAARADAVA